MKNRILSVVFSIVAVINFTVNAEAGCKRGRGCAAGSACSEGCAAPSGCGAEAASGCGSADGCGALLKVAVAQKAVAEPLQVVVHLK